MTILPCPFCEQTPTVESWHGGAPTKVMIACPGLHPDETIANCEVAPCVTGETPAEAITTWNTRPVRVARNAILDEAAQAARTAQLPDHFQWSESNTRKFMFGVERAVELIEALKS